MKDFNNRQGAFLLEAILAVFILSVALVGLIRGLLSSLNGVVEAEKYSAAILAADNALLEVIGLNGQKIVAPVQLKSPGENMTVRVTAKTSDYLPGIETLQQAQISVIWPGKVKDKTIEATTLIFGLMNEKNKK